MFDLWAFSALSSILAMVLLLINQKRQPVVHYLKKFGQQSHAFISSSMREAYNASVRTQKETLFRKMARHKQFKKCRVLEIGIGCGANLEFIPQQMEVSLVALEPNRFCRAYLEQNLSRHKNVKLDHYSTCAAESMKDIPSNSVDCAVSTLVLCSVNDQDLVLKEINRVLKPGAQFYFMEHVVAPRGTVMNIIQRFLNPLNRILFDGCNVNRETVPCLQSAAFREVHYEQFNAKLDYVCAMFRPHVTGYAVK